MTFDEWWQQQGIPMHYGCFSGSDMRWIAELAWKQAMSETVSVVDTLHGTKIRRTFIRFGDIPDSFKSKNHLTEKLEAGVSVYDAVDIDGEIKILFPDLTYSACVSLSGVLDRPMYEVIGNVIGYGSDGEPLLSNITKRKAQDVESAEKRNN